MAKKKLLSSRDKLILALWKMPKHLTDNKHGILLCLEYDRERINQLHLQNIVVKQYGLYAKDISRIVRNVSNSILIKDKKRNDSYRLFIKRDKYSTKYIQISLKLDLSVSNKAIIKSIFIARKMK